MFMEKAAGLRKVKKKSDQERRKLKGGGVATRHRKSSASYVEERDVVISDP